MILVTAATGTVGSRVVKELMEQKVPFRAGVHRRPLGIGEVESYIIDFNQSDTLDPALKDMQTIFLA